MKSDATACQFFPKSDVSVFPQTLAAFGKVDLDKSHLSRVPVNGEGEFIKRDGAASGVAGVFEDSDDPYDQAVAVVLREHAGFQKAAGINEGVDALARGHLAVRAVLVQFVHPAAIQYFLATGP